MATYVLGDIQGCYDPLRRLLDKVRFNPDTDRLWAVGDLVNRGPHSLEVLRFLESLGSSFTGVLGNHDLHFLAVALGTRAPKKRDTLGKILSAPDFDTHVRFIQTLPLLVHRPGVVMVHAGIPPRWTLDEALQLSAELGEWFQGERAKELLENMYGDEPARFTPSLEGVARARSLTNVFTRMRFCREDGTLNLVEKGNVERAPKGMKPWFAFSKRAMKDTRILFGHWAALGGRAPGGQNVEALDTGCVWGRQLTALHLETGLRYSTPASS